MSTANAFAADILKLLSSAPITFGSAGHIAGSATLMGSADWGISAIGVLTGLTTTLIAGYAAIDFGAVATLALRRQRPDLSLSARTPDTLILATVRISDTIAVLSARISFTDITLSSRLANG